MKKITLIFVAIAMFVLPSCTENYSNGERIGLITQFSRSGIIWKSYEGHLNLTQTGMNSSVPFDFSIDNDNEDQNVINQIDSAAQHGWKVKLTYHEVSGNNFFGTRGETDHFVTKVEVLDKNPIGNLFGSTPNGNDSTHAFRQGRVVDTIYVVIMDKKK